MHYCIIGAGSVGGYFGARLQQAGESVTYLVRQGRKENLLENGLVVKSYLGDARLEVSVETEPGNLNHCDVTILSVRNFHLDSEMLDTARMQAAKGSKIISFLNGVEHMERLRAIVPDESIIGGSAFIDSRLGPNGEIVHRGQDPTITLGTINGEISDQIKEMKTALDRSKVTCIISEDLLRTLWRKYLFVMMGTITGVAGATIGQVVSDDSLNRTLENFAWEMQSVAVAEGVNLDDSSVNEMLAEIRGMRKEWKSLMTEDLESGKPTEFESLWTYIIRKADEHSLKVPVLRMCYGILKIRANAMN